MSIVRSLLLVPVALALVAGVPLAATPGNAAPDFSVTDTSGKVVRLSDYKGKFVVLEWTNPECPFVQAQYGADAMQSLQKEAAGKGVVWLTINSTNQNHSEYKSGAQMNAWINARGAAPKDVL